MGGGADGLGEPAGGGAICLTPEPIEGDGAIGRGGIPPIGLGAVVSGGIEDSLPSWEAAYFLERAYCRIASLMR